MAPITSMPQFGTLSMSGPRAPLATRQFQNAEFNLIDQLQNDNNQTGGPGKKLSADVANDYAGIRAGMEPSGNKSIYGKIVDFFVGQTISRAQG